jgi:hypothetical protein
MCSRKEDERLVEVEGGARGRTEKRTKKCSKHSDDRFDVNTHQTHHHDLAKCLKDIDRGILKKLRLIVSEFEHKAAVKSLRGALVAIMKSESVESGDRC